MKRRNFLKTAGVAAAATAATTVQALEDKVHEWKMVTTWPKNFPGLGTGANFLAKKINEMTNGQVKVSVYGAGELVPAMESFDAVSNGTAQMGHGAAYYWKGKSEAAQFFSTVPYGLTADEMNSWLYYGGGMDLWKELYATFNLVPAAAGNTGVQMGGWFNKEINSIEDLKGLKMRIPGLGGEVLKRLGGTPVSLPGGEIFTSLQSGAIDATEWVGPYNDMAFGLYKVAKFYYYPGWHEPGTALETFINKNALEVLPKYLQGLVLDAARIANQEMFAEYNARNGSALEELVNKHGVQLKKFPDEVLKQLRSISDEVVAEVAKKDAITQKVYDSYVNFRDKSAKYADIAERAYLNARAL
ncbi:MAG: ABC transporter substrate-binding protein [Gammaproteobacteria bacterium]|nr:MAG: ABC transporter substrate-binding protein [Gammaproteobacteria bacterium]